MLIPYETQKLYPAYPIFLLGYQDETFGYNITTCSSSYSLGAMFVFGISKTANAAKQIARFKTCTVNFVGHVALDLIEQGGYLHAAEKLTDEVAYFIDETVNAPVLEQAFLALTLEVESIHEFDNYYNVTARIRTRYAAKELLENEQLLVEKIEPVLYAGDHHRRIYRTLAPESAETGGFFKPKTN